MIIIETIAGISFIFFLLCALASGLNEAFALLLNKRGRELQRAIKLLFAQIDPALAKDFYRHPLISPQNENPKWDSLRGVGLHLINFFRREKYGHYFPASYIDRRSFSRALSDLLVMTGDLRSAENIGDLASLKNQYIILESLDYNNYKTFYGLDQLSTPQSVKIKDQFASVTNAQTFNEAKEQLLKDIQKEIEKQQMMHASEEKYFSKIKKISLTKDPTENMTFLDLFSMHSDSMSDWHNTVENWFDQYMDRVSGWYKKRSHTNILWISTILVIFLNLDAIEISKAISTSSALRDTLTSEAMMLSNSTEDIDALNGRYAQIFDQLLELQMPSKASLRNVPGWIITILAMSLGAPFWFDMLSRFTRLRAAGPKP